MSSVPHKAGFVSIIGKPNVGKSTLMNALLGEKLSITTAKEQTTRHRIAGIFSGENFQIIYTDTPGIITPNYELQQCMMRAVHHALEDTDVLIWVVDVLDKDFPVDFRINMLQRNTPVVLLLNKVDLVSKEVLEKMLQYWSVHTSVNTIIPISALQSHNTALVLTHILDCLPEHPPYYPKDMLSDKPERFFASEIIREKILCRYHQEIPYSVEIVIDTFKEEEKLVKINVTINTERQSQKSILIGKKGEALKQVGIAARHDLEKFLGKKVFLEQHVKVVPGWRTKPQCLRRFGYT